MCRPGRGRLGIVWLQAEVDLDRPGLVPVQQQDGAGEGLVTEMRVEATLMKVPRDQPWGIGRKAAYITCKDNRCGGCRCGDLPLH